MDLRDRVCYRLWRDLMGHFTFPFLDAWLSRMLPLCRGLTHSRRLAVGSRLREGVKLLYWVALVKCAADHPKVSDPNQILALLQSDYSTPQDLLTRMGALTPQDFFALVSMRSGTFRGKKDPSFAHAIAILRRAVKPDSPNGLLMAWHGVPLWYQPAIEACAMRSGWNQETLIAFLRNTLEPAVLWLRVNKVDEQSTVVDDLRQSGFCITVHGTALEVEGSTSIYSLSSFKAGLFEVQDFSSQRIIEAADVHPGQAVWDCCAGAGGKTLGLASALGGRGALHATDVSAVKLLSLKKRLKRAGYRDFVRVQEWNGTSLPDFGVEISKRGGFHRVLVDAPCSASGTWRRNPDAKFQYSADALVRLKKTQRGLLSLAAQAVRPGGKLIYATCSFDCEENEQCVESFLSVNSDFHLVSEQLLGSPRQAGDTMYVAVLIKR